MNPRPSLQLQLRSHPDQLAGVREKLREWAARHNWSDKQISEIVLAVDEALTNILKHGYQGRTDGIVDFNAKHIQDPKNGEGLQITLRDYGRQVDPAQICGRRLDDIRPGGLGVHIIFAMMSSAEFSCAEGAGMRLQMTKYRNHVVNTGDAKPEQS